VNNADIAGLKNTIQQIGIFKRKVLWAVS